MGAGKTTVGRILAERLGWRFLDFDEEIERRAGASVAEIFRALGERGFRALESELTEALSSVADTVLAPGGGWVTRPGAFEALPAGSRTVWLRVRPEIAVQRVLASGVQRPLLEEGDPLETARALLTAREPHYRRADLIVDADAARPADIANEILDRLHK